MRLLGEIRKIFPAEEGAFGLQYTVVEGGGYFENVKRILEFTPQTVVLKCGGGNLRIEGEGLSLGKYFQGDLAVRGKIVKVEREGGKKI